METLNNPIPSSLLLNSVREYIRLNAYHEYLPGVMPGLGVFRLEDYHDPRIFCKVHGSITKSHFTIEIEVHNILTWATTTYATYYIDSNDNLLLTEFSESVCNKITLYLQSILQSMAVTLPPQCETIEVPHVIKDSPITSSIKSQEKIHLKKTKEVFINSKTNLSLQVAPSVLLIESVNEYIRTYGKNLPEIIPEIGIFYFKDYNSYKVKAEITDTYFTIGILSSCQTKFQIHALYKINSDGILSFVEIQESIGAKYNYKKSIVEIYLTRLLYILDSVSKIHVPKKPLTFYGRLNFSVTKKVRDFMESEKGGNFFVFSIFLFFIAFNVLISNYSSNSRSGNSHTYYGISNSSNKSSHVRSSTGGTSSTGLGGYPCICADGYESQSCGIQGACSHHGGYHTNTSYNSTVSANTVSTPTPMPVLTPQPSVRYNTKGQDGCEIQCDGQDGCVLSK
jgi:hypothetical protein